MWVFIIFVCKQNVINLMLVTAGMRESERSKAKSRTTNMQVNLCLFTLAVKSYIWWVWYYWDDLFNVYQAMLITLAVVIHLVVLAVMIVPSHFRWNAWKRLERKALENGKLLMVRVRYKAKCLLLLWAQYNDWKNIQKTLNQIRTQINWNGVWMKLKFRMNDYLIC